MSERDLVTKNWNTMVNMISNNTLGGITFNTETNMTWNKSRIMIDWAPKKTRNPAEQVDKWAFLQHVNDSVSKHFPL